MTKNKDIDRKTFESLLDWLDSDREIAGQKYESIRQRLILFFATRKCIAPEELADKTIDRVLQKVGEIAEDYEGNPAKYFYAVGKRILQEYFKQPKTEELSPLIPQEEKKNEEENELYKCLATCLQTIDEKDRNLILGYYDKDKQAKIDNRKLLAEKTGQTSEVLRIRAYRIRSKLQKCILNCMKKV